MEISCHVYFPFLLLKARQCGDSSAEEKGQWCFLTTGNNARISANILCVEGQHLFHIWTESSPFLSVTAPPMTKKGYLITCKQPDKMVMQSRIRCACKPYGGLANALYHSRTENAEPVEEKDQRMNDGIAYCPLVDFHRNVQFLTPRWKISSISFCEHNSSSTWSLATIQKPRERISKAHLRIKNVTVTL